MKGPRFSIAALVVLVALCGVGFAALRNATIVWASVPVHADPLRAGPLRLSAGSPVAGASQAFLVGLRRVRHRLPVPVGVGPFCGPHLATTKLLELAGSQDVTMSEVTS